ncbi:hypothetical protein BDA99DRAFT_495684 [Phascolomyces articulosus]|uniref:Uncharacterized protein n=1 Tax=Phascolomyces articulosus TaxID=60185 RepID=A0AAD5KMB5_9FUNG|nr:hypothetical protein BDA99DRAFT_495684 [Phascolomyces articulosus]
MTTEDSFVTKGNSGHPISFKERSIFTNQHGNNQRQWKHTANVFKEEDDNDEEYFTQKRNSSCSAVTSTFSNKIHYHNSNKRVNDRYHSKQSLHRRKRKSKFYIGYDDTIPSSDNGPTVESLYSSILLLESSSKHDDIMIEGEEEEKEDYNSSCCSSSDDDYFDPLLTPTNNTITTTTSTAFTNTNIPTTTTINDNIPTRKEDLLPMTRFVLVSVKSNNSSETTPSTVKKNPSFCSPPASLLRRCDTKCYAGLDHWFASKLHDC